MDSNAQQELADYFKNKGTMDKPPPYHIPPIPPPNLVQMTFLLPLPNKIMLTNKPPISFPEINPDEYCHMIVRSGHYEEVEPRLLRQFIKKPDSISGPYLNLMMGPKNWVSGYTCPAHLPSLHDLKGLSPKIVEDGEPELDQAPKNNEPIIREDYLLLVDPAPQFAARRKIYSLETPLNMDIGAFTNGLFIGQ